MTVGQVIIIVALLGFGVGTLYNMNGVLIKILHILQEKGLKG